MKKEKFEWIHSWCDETLNEDLPRVLLVGDSITRGYESFVRADLKGICYVDYIATSYAIDKRIYNQIIYSFVRDSKYTLIHFNHGLHGIHLSQKSYQSRMLKLLSKINKDIKLILATSTVVYQEGNRCLDRAWMKRVKERNKAIEEISLKLNCAVNDLYAVSVTIPKEIRSLDGTHYAKGGYELLAEKVVLSIKKELGSMLEYVERN